MKGVILAGGSGSRLLPLTTITNKHFLPVYNIPMIYYPIKSLVEAGIKDILIVTGGPNVGDFLRLLGDGSKFGIRSLQFVYQEGNSGIADALRLSETFIKDYVSVISPENTISTSYGHISWNSSEKFIVILGDNFLVESLKPYIKKFERQEEGARLLLKKVSNPERFGTVKFKGKKIISIEEKPKHPSSHYIVTGIYMYDLQIFDFIKELNPSERGEYEITDVHNKYLRESKLEYDIAKDFWSDCGTFQSLLETSNYIAKKNHG